MNVLTTYDWPVSATVTVENGGPVFKINDVPQPKLYFFGNDGAGAGLANNGDYTLFLQEIQKSKESGNHIYNTMIFLSNYTKNEEVINNMLANDPDSYFLFRCEVGNGTNWVPSNFPMLSDSEWMRNYDGTKGAFLSLGSELWKSSLEIKIRDLCDWLRVKPYADRVIGFQLANLETHEWFIVPNTTTSWVDYSAVNTTAFRNWLTAKYVTDAAMQSAWKDGKVTLATAQIPSPTARQATGDGFFHDVYNSSRQGSDYHRFFCEKVAETIDFCAQKFKYYTGNKTIISVFYGYSLFFSAYGIPAASGHDALRKVLDSPYIDMINSPASYLDRHAGQGESPMVLRDSVTLNGKIWITEDDERTHLTDTNDPDQTGYIIATTLDGSLNVLRRDFANAVVKNQGLYWMDLMSYGWYNQKELWDDFDDYRTIDASLYHITDDRTYRPDMAVIVDEESTAYNEPSGDFMQYAILKQQFELNKSGVKYGYYLLSDINKIPSSVKVFMFLNCWKLSATDRTNIDNLKNNGNALVWVRAPGYISDISQSVSNISSITGMTLTKFPSSTSPEITITVLDDILVNGTGITTYGAGPNNYNPSFYVNDNDAFEIGVYTGTNCKSLARKHFTGWTSIFSGSAVLPNDIIKNIVSLAGGFCYTPVGSSDIIMTNDKLMAIHATSTGIKNIRLREAGHVVDLISHKNIGDSLCSINTYMSFGETRMYSLGPSYISFIDIKGAQVTKAGSWTDVNNSSFVGGTAKKSDIIGNSVSFKFSGKYLSLRAVAGSDKGKVNVEIDGISYPYLDFYSSTYQYDNEYVIAQMLPAGNHTVTLSVSGKKNTSSSGNEIVLDAFGIADGT